MAALIGLAAAGAAAWVALAIDFGASESPRKIAVERLLAAARANDEAAMQELLMPDAQLIGYSAFDTQIVPAIYVADGLADCPTVAMSEALSVVAVELGCARGRHGEYILDFAFCGDRIAEISSDEDGRTRLSPLGRELLDRIGRLFGGRRRCG